jgi:hypothetical protein
VKTQGALTSGVKKVGFSGSEFYSGDSGNCDLFETGLLDERVFCKVISEIKNGIVTDIHRIR